MKSDEFYKVQALRVLSSFQALEFSLKMYIASTYSIIKGKLQGEVPFKYGYKDIKNYPLERLLNVFKNLNDNTELQKRLNKLPDERNKIAHHALLVAHEEIRDLLDEDLDQNIENIAAVEQELESCLLLMVVELERVIHKLPGKIAEKGSKPRF